jgi:hypothetical protein
LKTLMAGMSHPGDKRLKTILGRKYDAMATPNAIIEDAVRTAALYTDGVNSATD